MRKVLIVEDNTTESLMLRNLLEKEYDIIIATNGKEALDILNAEADSISAVLLDMMMPVMDGFKFLKKMRQNDGLLQIPVIATTAMSDEETQERALALGATAFAAKPYNIKLIQHTLRNSIGLCESAAKISNMRCDTLTGLFTREGFFEEAEKMIAAKEEGFYALICFDIDNFKVINDQYGTKMGDAVLGSIADSLNKFADKFDGIACRFMADKFAMLFPAKYASSLEMNTMMNKLMHPTCLGREIRVRSGQYHVKDKSVQIGSMFDRATLAEESIKGRYGVNVITYTESMRSHLLREQQIVSEMKSALQNGEFEVWLQPQYNHVTSALVGAETLIRWRKKDTNKLVMPSEFIPIFERNGFIYEMDKFIWEQACKLLRKWLDAGKSPLPISVNISRLDVFVGDFVKVITGLVKKYDLPIELLRLEITESAFAESDGVVISTVRKLIDLGFTVEIDDFGSGYSSLNTLKDVPADILKLDMKFLEGAEDTHRGGNILESVVRMAKWLGMSVIAEGVETKEQADFLVTIGCNYMQGYYYSRPITLSDYEKLFENSEKEHKMSGLETVEMLDNSAFWDPKSMDTLIFNSYVGGACIVEYHNGTVEILRANSQLKQELGYSINADFNLFDLNKFNSASNARIMHKCLDTAGETGKEAVCELCIKLSDTGEDAYLRLTARAIARAGKRMLFYCVVMNITEMRAAEQKEREITSRLRIITENVGCGITAITFEGDKQKLVFANNRFFDMFGYSNDEYHHLTDIYTIVYEKDRERVRNRTLNARNVGDSAVVEFRAVRKDGTIIWVRIVMSVATFYGVDEPVQLSVFSDISEEKEAKEKLMFLNDVAKKLLSEMDENIGINDSLHRVMEYFEGKRAYIFEFSEDLRIASNTYEVCAEGVSAEKDNLQNVPLEEIAFWLHAFDKQDYLYIDDVDALDDTQAIGKSILQAQNIKSLIAAPLRRDGKYVGIIGIDDLTKKKMSKSYIDSLGDFMSVMLLRRDLNKKISQENLAMMAIMNGIPGGFIRMQVLPNGKIVPLYISEGIMKMCEFSKEQIVKLQTDINESNDMIGVHPDDKDKVDTIFHRMMTEDTMQSIRLRLKKGNGDYIHVVVYGQVRRSDDGNVYLNMYYADDTAQYTEEQKQTILLDNVPCGVALYEFDGKNISAVHLNRFYWTMVGRKNDDSNKLVVLDAVHAGDREMVMQEITSAIHQNRDCDIYVRILNGDGEYRPFRIIAKIVKQNDGKYYIYAAYTPISDETMSTQELLPVALYTMLASSSDYAYVKGIDGRYVCCNPVAAKFVMLESTRDIVGKADDEIFDAEFAAIQKANDNKVISDGEAIVNEEITLVTKDGRSLPVVASRYPMRDIKGKIIGVYGVARDVSKEREEESRLKLLTDSIQGGLATMEVSPRGVRMQYCNIGFFNGLGYTREEYIKLVEKDTLFAVYEKDRPVAQAAISSLKKKIGSNAQGTYRCVTADGKFRWFSLNGTVTEIYGDTYIVQVVKYDITQQKEAEIRLRISEEEYRLAIQHSGITICRYDIKERSLTIPEAMAKSLNMPNIIYNVPESTIKMKDVSDDTQLAYKQFYEMIFSGQKTGTSRYQRRFASGRWIWLESSFSTIFDDNNEPMTAIISFRNVTEIIAKEAIYKKWQQSLTEREKNSYTLFCCNISKSIDCDSIDGALIQKDFLSKDLRTFDERTVAYANRYVYPPDREEYKRTLDSNLLKAEYYHGQRNFVFDYREIVDTDTVRWLRRTAELVEYPNSTDIMVYLLYEDIDKAKREEIKNRTLAERDPLTGLLNRQTLAADVGKVLSSNNQHSMCALLMLDLDGFKQINDICGHETGDRILVETGQILSSLVRENDLVARFGGDEFFVWLRDIPGQDIAEKKAKQICRLLNKDVINGLKMSVSVGIAVSPNDGTTYEELYHKSDVALYCVKGKGKNGIAFYNEKLDKNDLTVQRKVDWEDVPNKGLSRRRMLVVEDNEINRDVIINIFKDEFIIDVEKDGISALARLKRYGNGISVVLLDLIIPGMDGFAVLEKMRNDIALESIPVIVVSCLTEQAAAVKAIKCGASDYVTKPIDSDLLKLRVNSVIGRAENEKLRAHNRYLALQNDEVEKYREVLDSHGTFMAEYSCFDGKFVYERTEALRFSGRFDTRPIWDIFANDDVASQTDCERLKKLILDVKNGETTAPCDLMLELKTPSGERKPFDVKIIKHVDEYGFGEKLLIIFTESK